MGFAFAVWCTQPGRCIAPRISEYVEKGAQCRAVGPRWKYQQISRPGVFDQDRSGVGSKTTLRSKGREVAVCVESLGDERKGIFFWT